MNNNGLAIVVMLVSSAMYALSFVLQHKGAQQAIGLDDGSPADGSKGGPGAARLLRNPAWLTGLVLFGLSFIVHLVAIGLGAVAVVQPLIVTELVFIPPLAALISHAQVTRRDWVAILAVCAGLGAFLFVARPSEGDRIPSALEWVVTVAGCAVITGILMAIGRRGNDTFRAAMFGLGAGLVNALLAIVAKGAFSGDHASTGDWLTDPLVWLTVIVALTTVVTVALAFRAGPITTSTPAMISINPIASVLVAGWLFGEALVLSPFSVVVMVVAVVVVIGGVFSLSRAESVHATEADDIEAVREVEEEVLHLPPVLPQAGLGDSAEPDGPAEFTARG